uniref:Uncharacterized protein n=2 Tax=Nicotiana TaxID=4085 RepID=A0A1S3ZHN2_TOBAC|nr:PREDICTED: uncharacterized protein LOC104247301 [Nicotiana sylvestris]XP_016463767.1 PREDICTED: uncharacterized protein LOC107786773 [Nicotiana tabacum]
MASISFSHSFHSKNTTPTIQECHTKCTTPRSFSILISCQNRESSDLKNAKAEKQINKENKKGVLPQLIFDVEKLGNGLRDNLSPKHKGDWKDLTLMSLSFAVYVYISQKIVCAYCAWTSFVGQTW